MRYDLAELWRRTRNPRRKEAVLRKVTIPQTQATNLFRAAYLPTIEAWERAVEPIVAAYTRTMEELATDTADNIADELAAASESATAVQVLLSLHLDNWASRVEAIHRDKWRGAVLTATGVDLQTLIGAGDMRGTIAATIERNVSLVSSVSDEARRRISNAVWNGYRNRESPATVSKEIRAGVAMSRKRAIRIAADQNVKLASSLNEERRREAGIDTWLWIHSGKLHYRPEHKARHRKKYTDETAPQDLPGQLPFCGCTSQAVVTL